MNCCNCGKELPPNSMPHKKFCSRKCCYQVHNKHARGEIKQDHGPKIVRVEYPDCADPDYYTLAQYAQNHNEFPVEAAIWKKGIRIQ